MKKNGISKYLVFVLTCLLGTSIYCSEKPFNRYYGWTNQAKNTGPNCDHYKQHGASGTNKVCWKPCGGCFEIRCSDNCAAHGAQDF